MAKKKQIQEEEAGQTFSQANELEALRAKVELLEQEKLDREKEILAQGNGSGSYIKELQEIRKKNNKGAGHIRYKDVHDHVNIPLYHTNGIQIGKVVGPIHPGNAEDVYLRFEAIGIRLSIYKPTKEQVERYKASDEFKKLWEAFDRKRKTKARSKKESEVERLTKEIAKMTGVSADKVNRIKAPDEVNSIHAE